MDSATAEKFEKIMRLMDAAGSEGEAQAAAAAFQRLLLRHGVEEAEARRAAGTLGQAEEIVMRWVQIAPARHKYIGWRLSLMSTLAHFGLCRVFTGGKGYAKHHVMLLGRPTDLVAIVQMFDRTAATFSRLADADVATMRRDYPAMGLQPVHAGSWRDSFLKGAVSGLYDKLQAERDELLGTDSAVSALVVVRDAALDAAQAEKIGKVTKGQGHRARGGDAWRNGYQAGRNYNGAQELEKGRMALHG
jgi:hypothetical protein